MPQLREFARTVVSTTPLAYFPVRVRRGPAKGARWTLFPFSHYWRNGGDPDLEIALRFAADLIGKCCWDFGAHFGICAVGLAMRVGPTGMVAAFEPDPVAFRRLRYHVRTNHLPQVRLFNAAVSDSEARLNLATRAGQWGSSQSWISEDAGQIPVDALVPDALVAAGELRAPDFIKIDIEGSARRALHGSRESIAAGRPVILLNVHNDDEVTGAREVVRPLGYDRLDFNGNRIDWDIRVLASVLVPH
jgi:FkbM family methyltransferase